MQQYKERVKPESGTGHTGPFPPDRSLLSVCDRDFKIQGSFQDLTSYVELSHGSYVKCSYFNAKYDNFPN